jgi:hypothetical protein
LCLQHQGPPRVTYGDTEGGDAADDGGWLFDADALAVGCIKRKVGPMRLSKRVKHHRFSFHFSLIDETHYSFNIFGTGFAPVKEIPEFLSQTSKLIAGRAWLTGLPPKDAAQICR